jgi:hypothetical protein
VNTLIFDIETVPDTALGRRLYGLENLTDEQVGRIMFTKRRQENGSEFPRAAPRGRDLGGDANPRYAEGLESR